MTKAEDYQELLKIAPRVRVAWNDPENIKQFEATRAKWKEDFDKKQLPIILAHRERYKRMRISNPLMTADEYKKMVHYVGDL